MSKKPKMTEYDQRELSFYATCPTGLEDLLTLEIKDLFQKSLKVDSIKHNAKTCRGKVFFKLMNLSEIEKLHLLRIAGHIVWLVYECWDVNWEDRIEIDQKLKNIADKELDY